MPQELEQDVRTDPAPDFGSIVVRVAADVLATMFFEEAEPAACDHAWLPTAVTARVSFEGSHCGQFLLSISPATTRSIASGFLGLEPEEMTGSQPGEVVQELANILCGALMSTLWPESSLSLGTPELIVAKPDMPAGMHCCFNLPEGMVAVSIGLCAETGSV